MAAYIPAFGRVKVLNPDGALVDPARPVNLRDLMTHTSGLTYHWLEDFPVGEMYKGSKLFDANCSLEAAIEEERSRLMLADSVLGCLQIALDPEAIRVTPVPYFPEVLELAREFINKSVRRLDYEEIRRLLQSSMSCYR